MFEKRLAVAGIPSRQRGKLIRLDIAREQIEYQDIIGYLDEGQVTQYIGMIEDVDPHIRSFELYRDDVVLLCSDGLTDMLSTPSIVTELTTEQGSEIVCRSLVNAANQARGHGNVTVVYTHS